ncbi:MAG TPA: Gfo/Idh/MocA family oxidoreductase [Polyangiaceae bacterium]
MSPELDLPQAWPRPSRPRPIACVGAGGVVESAHLPAYRRIGLPVVALYDIDRERAERVATRLEVPRVHATLAELAAEPGVVFDLAVPARAVLSVLEALPEGSTVLIQKPMGETLAEAERIVETCKARNFVAAVNFQLRFAPNMLALGALVRSGALGAVVDFEVRVNVHTPWDDWPFLAGIPRHEVLYHSVHYLDLARSLLGEPKRVLSKTVRHPNLPAYSDTRSVTILDYGSELRAFVAAFHGHRYGRKHQASELKLEGTRGAAVAQMGVNLDYPKGEPDSLEVCFAGGEWERVPLRGSWFDEAFEGPMSNLQRFSAGEDAVLVTRVEDALRTMQIVEKCYTEGDARI